MSVQRPPGIPQIVRDPFPYLLFLVALLLFSIAYQFAVPFSFGAAGPFGKLFIRGTYDNQFDKKVHYTWTGGNARINIPGWGANHEMSLRLNVSRWQPNDRIADLTIFVNETELAEPQAAGQGWQEYTLPIADPRFLTPDNLRIRLVSDTFNPKKDVPGSTDDRTLGIQLEQIELLPLLRQGNTTRPANYPVWDPFVLPPLAVVVPLAAAVAVLYLGLVLFRAPRRVALALGAAAAVATTVVLVWARPFLPLFATQGLVILTVSVALGVAVRALLPRFMTWGGIRPPAQEINLLSLIFALGFLVKTAFLFYPQTISYDLLYHVHRVQFILEGKLFWSLPSAFNEFGGQAVPYLPSFYLFLAPWAELVPLETLVRMSGVLLDGVTVFFVYYLLKKHFDDGRAGLFAAWIYTVAPLSFIALSWGIYANIYGQFLTLLLVVALVESFDSLASRRAFIVISLLLALVLLSHTSVFASVVPFLAVWAFLIIVLGRMWRQRTFWALAGTVVAASVISLAVYYVDVVGMVTQSTLAIAATAGDAATRNVGDRSLTLLTLLQPARTSFTAVPLYVYAALAAGLCLLVYRAWRSPDRGRFLLTTILVAWLAAMAILMFVRAEFGFSSRYVNFAMPAISMGAGAAFSWVYRQRLAGKLIALGAAALLAAQGAYHWFVLAFYYYH